MIHPAYPLESTFFPTQLIIAIASNIIFLLILLGYRKLHIATGLDANSWGVGDTLTVMGILATLVGTMLFPFFVYPLLDYNVSQQVESGHTKFAIDITNRGLASANNVVVSLRSEGMDFSNLNYEPYQPKTLMTNDKTGYAAVEIGVIPAAATSVITGNLGGIESEYQLLMTHVRSDERVGYE